MTQETLEARLAAAGGALSMRKVAYIFKPSQQAVDDLLMAVNDYRTAADMLIANLKRGGELI